MGKSFVYKTGTPFDGNGQRVDRMKNAKIAKISKKRKMLLKRARDERLREAEVMKALRNKDEDTLKRLALLLDPDVVAQVEVALSAINMS